MSQNDFFERQPLPPPNRGGWQTWAVRGGAVVVGLLALAGLYQIISVEPTWHRAGFASDPGDFVRKHDVDYPVCAAWGAWNATLKLKPGYHMETVTAQPLPPKDDTINRGILLPNASHIDMVYCGFARGGAVEECSVDGCDAPVIVQLDDDIYTKGRALSLSLVGKDGKPPPSESLRVWVVWHG